MQCLDRMDCMEMSVRDVLKVQPSNLEQSLRVRDWLMAEQSPYSPLNPQTVWNVCFHIKDKLGIEDSGMGWLFLSEICPCPAIKKV